MRFDVEQDPIRVANIQADLAERHGTMHAVSWHAPAL